MNSHGVVEIGEVTEVLPALACRNPDSPFAQLLAPLNTAVAACVVFPSLAVPPVLGGVRLPEIGASVIQSIAIDVIGYLAVQENDSSSRENFSVKVNAASAANAAGRVPNAVRLSCVPSVSCQIAINGVYDCEFAPGKRNANLASDDFGDRGRAPGSPHDGREFLSPLPLSEMGTAKAAAGRGERATAERTQWSRHTPIGCRRARRVSRGRW